jgi:oxygen-independent coproporphyrinogen-3 oxidase
MLGETDENWQRNIEKTIALEPDSITIYQMELPYNTTITKDLLQKTGRMTGTVAGWDTKRRWVQQAFEALERAGYHVGSAYTVVRDPATTKFIYRDRLWQGADMVGLGVASFGHVNGVHVQNKDTWEGYSEALLRGELPLARAYRPTDDERMRRELVLQMKLGRLRPAYFADKYRVDILRTFADQFDALRRDGFLAEATADTVTLTREGLLRVDSLLPRFFRPEHTNIRYT